MSVLSRDMWLTHFFAILILHQNDMVRYSVYVPILQRSCSYIRASFYFELVFIPSYEYSCAVECEHVSFKVEFQIISFHPHDVIRV